MILRFIKRRLDDCAGAVFVVVGVYVGTDVAGAEILCRDGYSGAATVPEPISAMERRKAAMDLNTLSGCGKFRGVRLDDDRAADTIAPAAHRRDAGHHANTAHPR